MNDVIIPSDNNLIHHSQLLPNSEGVIPEMGKEAVSPLNNKEQLQIILDALGVYIRELPKLGAEAGYIESVRQVEFAVNASMYEEPEIDIAPTPVDEGPIV